MKVSSSTAPGLVLRSFLPASRRCGLIVASLLYLNLLAPSSLLLMGALDAQTIVEAPGPVTIASFLVIGGE